MLVQEEVQPNVIGYNWIFAHKYRPNKKRHNKAWKGYFIRPSLVSETVRFARAKELIPISDKKVMIVGLGMLGSPFSLELAQAGVSSLTLVDCDHIEAATALRWAGGVEYAGYHKADALKIRIQKAYPWVEVNPVNYQVGSAREPGQSTAYSVDELEEAIGSVDLVIDCTAEHLISDYLNVKCRENSTPFISLVTTPGGWGGFIVRTIPGKPGCWACAKYRQIDEEIPYPAGDEEITTQPMGCSMPTVQGTGFDASIVSNMAVRLAVSTLLGNEHTYPELGWDITVLHLRNHAGQPVPPRWDMFDQRAHADCDHCRDI